MRRGGREEGITDCQLEREEILLGKLREFSPPLNKKIYIKIYLKLFMVNGNTIRISQEIQCLSYAGFFDGVTDIFFNLNVVCIGEKTKGTCFLLEVTNNDM